MLRCAPGEKGGRDGEICLRPGGIALSSEGLPARIARLSYRGGAFRAEAVLDAEPTVRVALDLPEPAPVGEGDAVRLAIRDGWVLPQTR